MTSASSSRSGTSNLSCTLVNNARISKLIGYQDGGRKGLTGGNIWQKEGLVTQG